LISLASSCLSQFDEAKEIAGCASIAASRSEFAFRGS